MTYLLSVAAGIASSILALITYGLIVYLVHRGSPGMVGINVIGILPLTVAVLGFAAGFYLVFRSSN